MGTPVACSDNNPCTTDSCNPSSGCVYAPVPGAPCSDGNACTTNDACSAAGQCQAGPPLVCNDGNLCTNDACIPSSGCAYTNNTASCSDGNACNGVETCSGGTCHAGTPMVCDDNNACTTDSCSPASGCVYAPNPGASCSDGNPCTTNDTCDNAGRCQGGATQNCDEKTRTTYLGPSVVLQGKPAAFRARLLEDDDGRAVAARTLTFKLGTQSCRATTDATGTATCLLVVTAPVGPKMLEVSFAGDARYLPCSSSATVVVSRR